jgi:hypothetical protein
MLNLQPAKKYSAQWRLGCLSLSLGLLLQAFFHPESPSWQIASHFASGLLIGVSFGCFLMPSICFGKRNHN